jgi:hypothetical protein
MVQSLKEGNCIFFCYEKCRAIFEIQFKGNLISLQSKLHYIRKENAFEEQLADC